MAADAAADSERRRSVRDGQIVPVTCDACGCRLEATDSAGLAEVHAKDTDIIYVLGGSATVITGGSVIDGKETAADEMRGKRIDNGERRMLAKGDVMIVPNGTPHWFQDVRGPFTYYVVKVR